MKKAGRLASPPAPPVLGTVEDRDDGTNVKRGGVPSNPRETSRVYQVFLEEPSMQVSELEKKLNERSSDWLGYAGFMFNTFTNITAFWASTFAFTSKRINENDFSLFLRSVKRLIGIFLVSYIALIVSVKIFNLNLFIVLLAGLISSLSLISLSIGIMPLVVVASGATNIVNFEKFYRTSLTWAWYIWYFTIRSFSYSALNYQISVQVIILLLITYFTIPREAGSLKKITLISLIIFFVFRLIAGPLLDALLLLAQTKLGF